VHPAPDLDNRAPPSKGCLTNPPRVLGISFTLNGSQLTAQMSPTPNSSNITTLGSVVDSTWSAGSVGLRAWGPAGWFAQALVVAV